MESLNNSLSALETKLKEAVAKEIEAALEPIRDQISSDIVNEVTASYTTAISNAKAEVTEAYKAEIASSIASLESSLKNWINSALTGYYTINETDAKMSSLKTDLEMQLRSRRHIWRACLKTFQTACLWELRIMQR